MGVICDMPVTPHGDSRKDTYTYISSMFINWDEDFIEYEFKTFANQTARLDSKAVPVWGTVLRANLSDDLKSKFNNQYTAKQFGYGLLKGTAFVKEVEGVEINFKTATDVLNDPLKLPKVEPVVEIVVDGKPVMKSAGGDKPIADFVEPAN